MKLSYLESLVSLYAKVRLARSLNPSKRANDRELTDSGLLSGSGKSFSKNNPHVTGVGINFANNSAGNKPVLNKSVRRRSSYLGK